MFMYLILVNGLMFICTVLCIIKKLFGDSRYILKENKLPDISERAQKWNCTIYQNNIGALFDLKFEFIYKELDASRCMNALPDDYSSLVPKLLAETMSELSASFSSRINLATGDVVPETKTLTKGYISWNLLSISQLPSYYCL